ncbi:MAG: S-methyl-5-thioribose-1-phosphate isomerase [Oscillospiraceae bacterium]|nr:S-methyl-5-thioribose-1-phosphate isomerase [Oscillospiraceae bacterium]
MKDMNIINGIDRESSLRSVWLDDENSSVMIIDQTLLPGQMRLEALRTVEEVWDAIRRLKVRGAPAIGICAAYGAYLAVKTSTSSDTDGFLLELKDACDYLRTARPTAVNLFKALDRMEGAALNSFKARTFEFGEDDGSNSLRAGAPPLLSVHDSEWAPPQLPVHDCAGAPPQPLPPVCADNLQASPNIDDAIRSLKQEACNIDAENEQMCKMIGEYGLSLLKPGMGILTYCNAGRLATSGYGTALAPIFLGNERGYNFKVFACETRPLLQGARLTTYELMASDVDVTLICDNMASIVMKKGWINAVITGCDHVAVNGDVANKIGTSVLAILAKHYGVPFYICAPSSTIDLSLRDGAGISIEQRDQREITHMMYKTPMAPEGVRAYNPSFDVTDAALISAFITERGVIYPPFSDDFNRRLSKL